MKQGDNISAHWIDPGQVGTFVKIAAMASQCEIVSAIGPAVLLRNHMLNVMEHRCAFGEAGNIRNVRRLARGQIAAFRHPLLLWELVQMPTGFNFKDRNKVRRID
jgi:hypothetical protein